jgi:hypothetical protein
MAGQGLREQKRLAKRKAKREQRQILARDRSGIVHIPGDDWHLLDVLVPERLWDVGIGQLILSRRSTLQGQIVCSAFLVDVWCLGVKNALNRILSQGEYDELVDRASMHGPLMQVSPEYFCKLIHQAVDYAQSLGFAPHPDFRKARTMLSDFDPSNCHDTFEFGKDGKPFYVRGPGESLFRARQICNQVARAGGQYMVKL